MGFNTFHSLQKISSLDENFPILSYLLLLMFLLNVNAKYLWTKLIFSHSSQFLLFSPILVIFSHFLTLSNGMQLSNRILHSPRHSWGIGPLRCPQRTSQRGPGHILLFHSPKSHCHYQHIWKMTVKLQLNTQSGTEMPWRQDVTETWLCLLHSCTATGGSHSKRWC